MLLRNSKSYLLAGLLFGLSQFSMTSIMAQDVKSFDISEFHRILDAVRQSNIPDNIKARLFQDVRSSLMQNVKSANIPDDVKRILIQDLESATQK